MTRESAMATDHLERAAQALDRGEDALAAYHAEAAVALAPDHKQARVLAAAALRRQGLAKPARVHLREALKADANDVPILTLMAEMLVEARQDELAMRHFRRALTLAPDDVDLRANYGAFLMRPESEGGDWAKARRQFEHALARAPDCASALANLGVLEHQEGRFARALALLERACAALRDDPPRLSQALRNAADALRDLGRLDRALERYDAALAADPGNAEAASNRAMVLLLGGRYADGFDAYEARWSLPGARRPTHATPAWDGAPLAGGRLAVLAEQGVGDQIMFAECLGDAAARAPRPVVTVDPRLVALFARSFPKADVVAHGDPPDPALAAEDIAAHIAIGSLPRLLRRSVDAFSRHAGYLRPDPQRVAALRAHFAALGPGRTVGISWRSGSTAGGALRSADLATDWAPILDAPGCRFVNLQYGDVDDELAAAPVEVHLEPGLDLRDDLDGLAAAIAALDLVVTTANVTAHMAGAVGRTAFTLVPAQPSWRWLARGVRCPWYPALRLFRQGAPGDWQAPIAALRAALDASDPGDG